MPQYTAKQKAAYYKKLSGGTRKKTYAKKTYAKKSYTKRPYTKKARVSRDKTTGVVSTSRSIGGALGGSFGPLGSAIGSGLGTLVGEGIKYFTGKGDYEVHQNSLLSAGNSDMPPIKNTGVAKGGVRYMRSEYICDIISSPTANTFLNQSFSINPGLANTFQWLSQVAPNYEEYVVDGMYFEYRTMSSDSLNSVNTALGQIIMSAEYNAGLPGFTNKQEMENYEGGVSCKPSCSLRYFVECEKNQSVLNELYVRAGSVPTGQDQRLYDLANFQIATNGLQGTSVNCGELWVCYDIVLRKPKLFAAIGGSIPYYFSSATNSNALPLGASAIAPQNVNTMSLGQTGTVLTFPTISIIRSYLLIVLWQGGSGAVLTYPTITPSTGVTESATASPQAGVTAFSAQLYMFVTVAANVVVPTLTFGTGGTLPSVGPTVEITCVQVPSIATGN